MYQGTYIHIHVSRYIHTAKAESGKSRTVDLVFDHFDDELPAIRMHHSRVVADDGCNMYVKCWVCNNACVYVKNMEK